MHKPINFNWTFKSEFKKDYIKESFKGDVVDLPHTVKKLPLNYFSIDEYQMISTYQKKLNFNVKDNERIYITFEGVMLSSKVYLNGKLIGEHFGGYLPFTYDITKFFKSGEDNLITVVVDSNEQKDIPPFGGVVDYLTYGGIYREVYVDIKPKLNFKNVMVEGDMNGQISIHYELNNATSKHDIEFTLLKDNIEICKFKETEFYYDEALLWDVDNPNLYEIEAKVTSKFGVDTVRERFGFRTAYFTKKGFYLNGKYMKLIGLNRHQSYPYIGYAAPKSLQEEDADLLKNKLGVNYVRCSHYPMSKHFLNRCDELGLILLEEIPGWQHVSKNEKWRKLHLQNVEDMIKSLFNHPSIVIWGVRINEGPDDHELYVEANKIAKTLDPNRATGGVRNFKHSELLEDVYTYNDFFHYGPNKGLEKPSKVCKNAPYLVTEFNGHMFPTKAFDQEDRLIEHTLRHARVLDAMYGDKRVCGCSGWCMNDYNTHLEFGSGDMICYHGVNDMFRNEKYAASIYSSQQDRFDVLKVLSKIIGGEKNACLQGITLVTTNADYIELYRNGKFINSFYPKRDKFKNLPHPPIVIDDYVGTALVEDKLFKEKDSYKLTEVLNHAICYGFNSAVSKYALRILGIILKYRMPMNKLVDIASRYVIGWGDKSVEYEVRAIKNGKVVKKEFLGPTSSFRLEADKNINLKIGDTYDAKSISVKALDEHDQVLTFLFEPLHIEVTGDIELLSPSDVSLQAGQIKLYVRSKNKGSGQVIIHSRFNTCYVDVVVE